MGRRKLVFPANVPFFYKWVDLEVLGTPSVVDSEFLDRFRERNLLTPEGEYEDDYILETPLAHERVCYVNHGRGPNWLWMYDVLFTKFGVRVPFTDFQFEILNQTRTAPSQLHPNSWAMIRAFEIISQHLGIPPSPRTFFYLFTLTRPSGGGLTTGWLSFRAHVNRKIFNLYEESFHHFKPVFFKVFAAPGQIPCWETQEGDLKFNCYWNKDFEAPRIAEDDLRDEEKALANFLLECFGEKHLNLKHIIGVDIGIARSRLEEMAAVNAFDEFRRRMLKRSASSSVGVAPSTEKETRPENPRPDIVPEPVASDVPQRKKQKGKRISVQKTGRNSSSSPEHNVLAKDFPYADFVDRELLTPSALKELEGDEGDLVAKLQWAGRTMLKSAALVRYSEAMVSSGVRAHAEKRAKEKELASISKEKRELEEARQKMTSEIEELRKQIGDKDRQLEAQRKDLEDQGTEIAEIKAALDKARVDSDAEVTKLKDEIRDMEDLWEQAMEGAKDNILAQAKVICPDADFRDVGLDKRVINGRIELAPPPSDATN